VALPASVGDEPALAALLDATRAAVYPELEGVSIGLRAVEDLAYLRAWTELDTVALDDGRARTYTVEYDPVLLSDPPDPGALAAVLTHELGHVSDYVGMDSAGLVDFALWYASQDPMTSDELAAYERATDEQALTRGCAAGLARFREWVYAHADAEVEAEKRRNYYSPEEIDAWVQANGECIDGG